MRANAFVVSLVHDVTKDSVPQVRDVIRTAASFRSFSPPKLATYPLPVAVATDHPLGDVLLLKQPDAQAVVDRFLGRAPAPRVTPGAGATPGAAAPADTRVTVLNALGTTGLAASTAAKLRRSGYRITGVGNAPAADLARSQIAYAPGRLADARALAASLLGGARLVEDPGLTAPHLTLILGPGFTGVRAPTPGGHASTAAPPAAAAGSGSPAGGSTAKKARSGKPVPDLRPYDPRPC